MKRKTVDSNVQLVEETQENQVTNSINVKGSHYSLNGMYELNYYSKESSISAIGKRKWQKHPILVLIAALDEQEGIGPTISEIKSQLSGSQILVVDGRSHDKTALIAHNMGVKVIYREKKGKGDALAYALNNINEEYAYVVLTDADFTYPAEFIPKMLEIMEENPRLGMVCGNRFNTLFHTEWMSKFFYMGNRILALIHNLLNGIKMRDPLTGLRIIRWEVLKNWKPISKGFDIEVEMNHHIERQGYGISEIDIPYRMRLGEKKLKFQHGFQILKRMIAVSKL